MNVEPPPTEEEAAAIVAALEALRGAPETAPASRDSAGRSRWRLAGLLVHPPWEMEPEDPLWTYTCWEDIT